LRNVESNLDSIRFLILMRWQDSDFVHAKGEEYSQGGGKGSFDENNEAFTQSDLEWFERCVGPKLPSIEEYNVPPAVGRLGQSLEGAGKRGIFAIGNYVNQRLLKPVHDWLMRVLKSLPTDVFIREVQC
jgi:hypothetical protein